jgi:hypothetical protein
MMSMPIPTSLRQKVATSHGDGIAVHHRPDPFTFNDEPECVLGVAVFGGVFVRH